MKTHGKINVAIAKNTVMYCVAHGQSYTPIQLINEGIHKSMIEWKTKPNHLKKLANKFGGWINDIKHSRREPRAKRITPKLHEAYQPLYTAEEGGIS